MRMSGGDETNNCANGDPKSANTGLATHDFRIECNTGQLFHRGDFSTVFVANNIVESSLRFATLRGKLEGEIQQAEVTDKFKILLFLILRTSGVPPVIQIDADPCSVLSRRFASVLRALANISSRLAG
jgi:hypothetical protein